MWLDLEDSLYLKLSFVVVLQSIGVPFRTAECNTSGTKWFRCPKPSLDGMGTTLDHIKDIGAFELACAEMRDFTVVWKNGI